MYVNRIILRDVRNFKHLDITLRNDWTKEPLKSVLFTGPNGSGKTTLLRVLGMLWDQFGAWLTPMNQFVSFPIFLIDAGLAAIELHDFPLSCEDTSNSVPIWLYVGRNTKYISDFLTSTKEGDLIVGDHIAGTSPPKIRIPPAWLNSDTQRMLYSWRQKLQVGTENTALLPNAIFFEAENRQIFMPEGKPDTYPESTYRWLVSYEPQGRQEGHIESMLRNLKVRSPKIFQHTVEQINTFFVGKQLGDFDDYLRLTVRLADGQTHYIEDLSAGERQSLIIFFMVARWLMPGGIVLIDEPDLHLHVSLQRHLISVIERIVHDKGGQLIIASHSPTMWDKFHERQRINLAKAVKDG